MALTNGPKLGMLVNGAAGEGHYTALMKMFRQLDAIIMPSIKDKDLATPPASPADGDCYIVAASPTGAWAGNAGKIARYSTVMSGWEFYTPQKGWLLEVDDEADFYYYSGTAWVTLFSLMSTQRIITDSTTARTLALADAGMYIRMTNGSANSVTVPPNSSVAFAIGTQVTVRQAGAGLTSFVAGSGVTINAAPSLNMKGQHYAATLVKVATDTWDLMGALA